MNIQEKEISILKKFIDFLSIILLNKYLTLLNFIFKILEKKIYFDKYIFFIVTLFFIKYNYLGGGNIYDILTLVVFSIYIKCGHKISLEVYKFAIILFATLIALEFLGIFDVKDIIQGINKVPGRVTLYFNSAVVSTYLFYLVLPVLIKEKNYVDNFYYIIPGIIFVILSQRLVIVGFIISIVIFKLLDIKKIFKLLIVMSMTYVVMIWLPKLKLPEYLITASTPSQSTHNYIINNKHFENNHTIANERLTLVNHIDEFKNRRLEAINISIKYIQSNPIVGINAGSFKKYNNDDLINNANISDKYVHPHNILLELLLYTSPLFIFILIYLFRIKFLIFLFIIPGSLINFNDVFLVSNLLVYLFLYEKNTIFR